jgi:hypothetical protein
MSSAATVTIPYTEYENEKKARRAAEQKLIELEAKLSSMKVEASDPHLISMTKYTLSVVRFAVASLPPESIKGWPFTALREIALLLPIMPDATQDHTELAMTLETFALECERYELRRRHENGGLDPQTLMPIPAPQ